MNRLLRRSHRGRSRPLKAGSAGLLLVLALACGGPRMTPRLMPAADLVLPDACVTGEDSDGDGVTDACELQLATAFAPLLMVSPSRCTPPLLRPRPEIPGGYLHAVQPVRGAVRIAYLPAYYRDCGWSGAKCLLVDCRPHAGDSELIVVDVVPVSAGRWVAERIFLSAHCFGRTRGDCRWYEGEELADFGWVEQPHGAPVVWVSEGRQANYPSRGACERGHWRIDTCSMDARPVRFPVRADRNIGSRQTPIREPDRRAGCVSGSWVERDEPLLTGADEVECFWAADAPFSGWQGGRGPGATAYGRYLEILEF